MSANQSPSVEATAAWPESRSTNRRGGIVNKHPLGAIRSSAYIMSQCISAMAKIAGMQAENQERAYRDESPAYTMEDFEALIPEFGLDPEEVLRFFETK
jgi:hypothetical protein